MDVPSVAGGPTKFMTMTSNGTETAKAVGFLADIYLSAQSLFAVNFDSERRHWFMRAIDGKHAFVAYPSLLVYWALVATTPFLATLPKYAHAAVTDCKGMSVDGQAECVLPTYSPPSFGVCDIAGAYAYRANAWMACSAEMGITNPIPSEATAVAYANCFDKKLVPNGGGVTGSVPWRAAGTYYNDNLCTGGTVRVVNGHYLWGVGTKAGSSSNFAFTRSESVSCPAGHTAVSKVINGVPETVACKPNATCNPDQKWWGPPKNACLNKVVTVAASKPPQTCQAMNSTSSAAQAKSAQIRNSRSPGVGDPIFPLTGAMSEVVATGFNLDGGELVLSYDTARALGGFTWQTLPSFGKLWSSSMHKNLVIGTGAGTITAYRGDRSVVTFTLKNGIYVPDSDIRDRIVASGGRYFYSDAQQGVLETYSSNGQLTLAEGVNGSVLNFSYSVGASATVPAAGYLTQVTDKAGRFLKFEYQLPVGVLDNQTATSGLISKITNAANQTIVVTYDTNLNLVGLTWADAKALQFQYASSTLPWAMTGRLDENGSLHATWDYDTLGRAIGTSMALGVEAYALNYTAPPSYVLSSETIDPNLNLLYQTYEVQSPSGVSIAMPNGQTVTWATQGMLGAPVLVGSSQPAGSGCAASSSSSAYDSQGNLQSRDDFQGVRTCFGYDSSNREVLRVEGLSTAASCLAVLPVNAVLPAGARRVATEWHPDWPLASKVSTSGRTENLIYQGQTDPFTSAVANCSTTPNMANDKPLPVLCKKVIQSTADSSTQVYSYTYDDAANLISARNPVDNDVTYQYSQASNGNTDSAYDRVKLLLHGDGSNGSNTFVDNSAPAKTISIGYGAPVLSSAQKKFGASSLYFPGASSIRVAGIDGVSFWSSDWTLEFSVLPAIPTQGRASVFGNRDNSGGGMGGGEVGLYFSSGLLTSFDVSLGESSQWAGFGVSTSTPGFTEVRSPAGAFNQIAITKQGLTYTFFLNGRMLQSITRPVAAMTPPSPDFFVGAANHNNFYPYYFNGYLDDLRITMGSPRYVKNYAVRSNAFPDLGVALGTDPSPHNLERIVNSAGHVTQITQYDLAGRMRQMIDPKGVVTDITYTPRGWVSTVATTAPGQTARTTNYGYDAVGQLTSVMTPDGQVMSYSYDAAHRLVGVTDSRGNAVSYTLDNMGNRIGEEVKDPQGTLQRAISRSFDALNRLQNITGAAQ